MRRWVQSLVARLNGLDESVLSWIKAHPVVAGLGLGLVVAAIVATPIVASYRQGGTQTLRALLMATAYTAPIVVISVVLALIDAGSLRLPSLKGRCDTRRPHVKALVWTVDHPIMTAVAVASVSLLITLGVESRLFSQGVRWRLVGPLMVLTAVLWVIIVPLILKRLHDRLL